MPREEKPKRKYKKRKPEPKESSAKEQSSRWKRVLGWFRMFNILRFIRR